MENIKGKMFYPIQTVTCAECGATYKIGALELTRSAIVGSLYKHTCPHCRRQNASSQRELRREMVDCYNVLKVS